MVRNVVAWVTHERLDDEVIAINLETGAYFAFDDVAADCWTLVTGGQDVDDIPSFLAAAYGVAVADIRADIDAFIAELDASGLIESDLARLPATEVELPVRSGFTYAAPVVNRFDDLEELLLLDPIHEVDDAGWPVARE